MWILTTIGFFSAVQSKTDPDTLVVRARTRADLEALCEYFDPPPEIMTSTNTDYPCRVLLDRSDFSAVVESLARGIDYGNFKGAVLARQGREREHIYHEVWATLTKLERPGDRVPPPPPPPKKKVRR